MPDLIQNSVYCDIRNRQIVNDSDEETLVVMVYANKRLRTLKRSQNFELTNRIFELKSQNFEITGSNCLDAY